MAQELLITEFMAINDGGLKDEDGQAMDWIEICNPGGQAADLTGWYLSDEPSRLTKWQFPARQIAAGQFLVVFASGKDRRPAQGNLHANFRLAGEGGYLALTMPDGRTIRHEYRAYPAQRPNISYGDRSEDRRIPLVAEDAPVKVLVPSNSSLGISWTGGQEPFADDAWVKGTNGVGYITWTPGFVVRNFKSRAMVEDLGAAEEVIQISALHESVAAENAPSIDYLGTTDTGHYGVDRPFPGTEAGEDVEDFVILATGRITIPSAGSWTFGVMSDDGFGLEITRGTERFEMSYPDPRSPADTIQTFNFGEAGEYDLRLVYFERGGGSGLELFAAKGSYGTWDATHFRLIGDGASGGLEVNSPAVSGEGGDLQNLIKTDLKSLMDSEQTAAYLRFPFASNPSADAFNLLLKMQYDDGYVAYLNGHEIARRNAPEILSDQAVALTNRPVSLALEPETIPIDGSFLLPGPNILAIHGLNDRKDSPDFLIRAVLEQVLASDRIEGFFDPPTPGAPNGGAFAGFVDSPVFSVSRGFKEQTFDLALFCATEGAEIRYTTNGSVPALTNGLVYSVPIRISGTRVIRAAGFRTGYRPSRVETHSYLFLDDIISQDAAATLAAGFPSSWKGTAPDYGLDRRVIGQNGTDKYGGKYARSIQDDLKSIPTLSLVMPLPDLFGNNGIYANPQNRGPLWERAVSAELIHPDGREGFQENAGLSIQGGAFRGFNLTKKKSFRLLFKSIYGAAKLRYPFFGPDAADEFNSLTLRANNNDGYQWNSAGGTALYIRDAFALESARHMGMIVPRTSFVHLYINGFYWGLYNPVERPDAAFTSTYFGGNREDWDAINYDSAPDGNYQAWNRMLAQARAGLANNANYERIQGNNPDGSRNPEYEDLLDVDNLIDYMIVNLYGGNEDWPHRNWYAGRNRVNGDGFKFFPWDTEAALGLWATLNSDRTSVNSAVATPYAAARANPEFRIRFADHVYRHFFNDGIFHVDTNRPAWDPAHPERNRPAALFVALANQVEKAMVAESARWGDQHASNPYTRDEHWAKEKTNLLSNYFPRRSAIVLEQLRRVGLYPRTDPPALNQQGGRVPVGFPLTLTSLPGATIYYTTNGSDPRTPVTTEDLFGITLVNYNAPKKALVPSPDNNGNNLGATWRGGNEPFDDSSWTAGTGGVGYDRETTYSSYFGINLRTAMDGKNGSAFIRIPFQYDGTHQSQLNYLTLRVRYDDGFAVFLNGIQIAAANAPSSLSWNAVASAQNSDTAAINFEDFKADAFLSALRKGNNILAIHGLNNSVSSSDFLIGVELLAGERRLVSAPTTAMTYTGPIVLRDLTTLKARVLNGTEWSALQEVRFVVGDPMLKLSELHYHPADPTPAETAAGFGDADEFEFVELVNAGEVTCDLDGLRFVTGIEFDFSGSAFTRLAPGQYVVIVRNHRAFEFRYGIGLPVAGEYSGRLDNAGERVTALNAENEVVLDFTYATRSPWPSSADGDGFSLETNSPDGDLNSAEQWKASAAWGGSPGRPNPPPVLIRQVTLEDAQLRFQFDVPAGSGYTIYTRDTLATGDWTVWRKTHPVPENTTVQVQLDIPDHAPNQFYRVSIP
ncbi:MAG TPA: CotH kinase family protein [Candidatus Paceibacterota bacterium]|nr:CotH kinase family protein [Verrucomicrobiota bacterium]HRY48693.1 CotH kinase family protein [Candidatus Paceibacterota bacterium]